MGLRVCSQRFCEFISVITESFPDPADAVLFSGSEDPDGDMRDTGP